MTVRPFDNERISALPHTERSRFSDTANMGMPTGILRAVRHVVTFKAVGEDKTEMTVTEHDWT
jgi:hypothetical protein